MRNRLYELLIHYIPPDIVVKVGNSFLCIDIDFVNHGLI